jgi:hypothetical protein
VLDGEGTWEAAEVLAGALARENTTAGNTNNEGLLIAFVAIGLGTLVTSFGDRGEILEWDVARWLICDCTRNRSYELCKP